MGIDDYLDAGNPAALDITGDQITISAWVNVDEVLDGGIVSKGGYFEGYRLMIYGSKRIIEFQLTGESYMYWGTTELEAGRWYHVVATYDGSYMKAYINGVEEPTEFRSIWRYRVHRATSLDRTREYVCRESLEFPLFR